MKSILLLTPKLLTGPSTRQNVVIWVSVKRTLKDKCAVNGQNVINCVQFQENVQNQSKL